MVSGSGRSLANLLRQQAEGALPVSIGRVIASRSGIGALEHAAAHEVPAAVVKPSAITADLEAHGIELVVMAGYLKHWPIPPHFVGRTLNIHPALLPLFGGKGYYGDHVHRAVLESGMRVSGCTVHFVTEEYDAGAIIDQRAVPVLPTDDVRALADRVFAAELELLPACVRALASGALRYDPSTGRSQWALPDATS